MRIDIEYVVKKQKELTAQILRIETNLKQTSFYKEWQKYSKKAEPNFNSNLQLANYLYIGKNIKPEKTTDSGKGSTDEEALKQLNIPELNQILEMRKLKKMRDTYLGAFEREQVNDVVHPFFNLHTVKTYRSSSNSPNFQNLPSKDEESMKIVKSAIYARKGNRLIELDFSGLEVSIAACYHKDPNMLKYLKTPGSDMHGDIAQEIFLVDDFNRDLPEHHLLRAAAKNGFVFPEFYGDYYKNCAINLCAWVKLPLTNWKSNTGIKMPDGTYISDHLRSKGIKSFKAFENHIQDMEDDLWQNRFPTYARWEKKLWHRYQINGFIETLTGFTCSGLMKRNEVINYPVQGAAFHCLLWSLIEIDKILQLMKSKIVGQIHDSIVIDVNPFEFTYVCNLVKNVTTQLLPKTWDWIIVPLKIDIKACEVDESWAELKEMKN